MSDTPDASRSVLRVASTSPEIAAPTSTVVAGWWEWLVAPSLSGRALRAKLDTAAHSSALGAHSIRVQGDMVAFCCEFSPDPVLLPLCDVIEVSSSCATRTSRPVVALPVAFAPVGDVFDVKFSLADRSQMRFPVLLGRTALSGRVVVDPSRSVRISSRKAPR